MFINASLRFLGVTWFKLDLAMGDLPDAPDDDEGPITLMVTDRNPNEESDGGGAVLSSDTMPFGFGKSRDSDEDEEEDKK